MADLTEKEASENLERAIRDWFKVSTDVDRVVTGWFLIADGIPLDGRSPQILNMTSSDGMTDIQRLGLTAYADAVLRRNISQPWEDE